MPGMLAWGADSSPKHWREIPRFELLACVADYLLKKDAHDDLTIDDLLRRATEAWEKQQP